MRRLVLALAILATGCLAVGCGSGGKVRSAVSSLTASRSVTVSPPTLPSGTSVPAASSEPQPTPNPASAASAGPASSGSPAASGSGSSLGWLWVILGAIVVIGVIALIARRSGRRSAATADRRSRVIDAYAKGSALYDSMSIAEAPGAQAEPDASARWADIQRRADDLAQALYALRETARGEAERARAEDVLGTLQAVRSAMAAQRGQAGAGAQGARAHALLQNFEASLRELRDPSEYPL